jgi:hypothetical protein
VIPETAVREWSVTHPWPLPSQVEQDLLLSRAIYQRPKRRDLFDLWLGTATLDLDPRDVLSAFAPYRPEGLTRPRAVANLRAKLADQRFRNDFTPLAAAVPGGYDIDQAADLVIGRLLNHL